MKIRQYGIPALILFLILTAAQGGGGALDENVYLATKPQMSFNIVRVAFSNRW